MTLLYSGYHKKQTVKDGLHIECRFNILLATKQLIFEIFLPANLSALN